MKWFCKQLFIGHWATLVTGSLLYFAFRPKTLLMFSWAEEAGFLNLIYEIRQHTKIYALPEWILFALPDGLWIFSYMSLLLLFWKNEINRENIFWIIGLPVLAVLSEVGQLLGLVRGTFDVTDILMYALGSLTPILLYTNKPIKIINHE